METVEWTSQKLDPEPGIPFLGIYAEGMKAERELKGCLYAQIHGGITDRQPSAWSGLWRRNKKHPALYFDWGYTRSDLKDN